MKLNMICNQSNIEPNLASDVDALWKYTLSEGGDASSGTSTAARDCGSD